VSIRGHESYLVFPSMRDGSGILQQEKTGMEPVAQTSF
jgi:hypothetical protein